MAAAVQADANRWWKQGPVVEVVGGWARKRAERAITGEVLDGRPGGGRELGGAEVMEAKRGKLESSVHPLQPRKVVDGGGASCGQSGCDGEAVGVAKCRWLLSKRSWHGRRRCSDRAADGWAPMVLDFFPIYSKLAQI
jgi:hypothetical protein